jgi:hypothetical protein
MTDEHSNHELLSRALGQLRSAIELLDLAAAPGQIAAHIDLGACQLADFIEAASGLAGRDSDQRGEAGQPITELG